MAYFHVKRWFDFTLALTVLIVFSPLVALVAISIKIFLGSPIIFSQARPGYKGEIFKLYKFRSMTDERDDAGELLPDAQRLNKFGRILRSTSLDEIPQLINVVKGDMSIVGPRPLLVEYLPLYSEFQMRRHDARPGITGLAQINGRNSVTWREKFAHDVQYVESCSFTLDITIMLKTALKIVARKDVDADGNIGMEKFRGEQ